MHGKKREHRQNSYNFGPERLDLVRIRHKQAVYCVQSFPPFFLLARGLSPPIRHLPFGIAGDLSMILNKMPYRFLAFLRSMTRSTSRNSKPSAFKALRIRYVLVTPCSAAAIDIARSR